QYVLNNKHIDRFGGSRETRAGHLSRAFAYADRIHGERRTLTNAQAGQRKDVSSDHRRTLRAQIRAINQDYKRDLDELRQRQKADLAAMRKLEVAARKAPARPAPKTKVEKAPPVAPPQQNLTPKQQAFLDLLRETGRDILTPKTPESPNRTGSGR